MVFLEVVNNILVVVAEVIMMVQKEQEDLEDQVVEAQVIVAQ